MSVRLIILLLALASTAALAQSGKLYRWVDDEGKVHYSDQIPPEHAARAREQLNQQGIRVDSVDSAPSPEQLEAARAKAQAEAEDRREAESQKRRDQILLNAYVSVADIERSREAEIAALQRTVEMTRAAQDSQRRQLAQLVGRAADAQRSGRTLPGDIVEEMTQTRQRINERQAYIEEKRAEQAAVFAEYEQDIVRYRELTQEESEEG